jgi:hypothetical protein
MHPDRTLLVRYEDLVDRPEAVLEDLFRFLGEELPPDLIRNAFEKPAHMLAAWAGHEVTRTKKIETGRTGGYRRWDPNIIRMAAPIVNPLLETWGYEQVKA